MSILDQFQRPLEYLRISLTDRCNLRCVYCMPAHLFPASYSFLPQADLLSFDEIVQLVQVCASLGVKKVRLTGGEPLVRPHVENLVERLAKIAGIEEITMTTNGVFLAKKAATLQQAGLTRLNVSVDSLNPDVFRQMNGGRAELEDVLAGLAAAELAGFSPIKINTVVQRGVNDHTILELARYFRERGHILRFIEFMDVGTVNGWCKDDVMTTDEMIQLIQQEFPLKSMTANYFGEVVQRYEYADGTGEIGFISSVSQPFCGGCTRLRLTADGKLYTCLFSQKGHNLRNILRDDASTEELEAYLSQIWRSRTDRYSEERSHSSHSQTEKVEMFHMGG